MSDAADQTETPNITRVIAHRGASADHPENTIEAFVGAKGQGAAGIELDVRLTSDDVLVLSHDAILPDGRMVRQVDSADLPPSVPTLAEALEVIDPLWTNIELKNLPADPDYEAASGLAVAVAGLVAAYEAHERVLVSSFDFQSILRIREADPTIPIGWLVWGQTDPNQIITRAEGHAIQAIHPNDLLVDQNFVGRAHEANLAVNVWTVDDPDRIRELAGWGVDAIITNSPGRALEALQTGESGDGA